MFKTVQRNILSHLQFGMFYDVICQSLRVQATENCMRLLNLFCFSSLIFNNFFEGVANYLSFGRGISENRHEILVPVETNAGPRTRKTMDLIN